MINIIMQTIAIMSGLLGMFFGLFSLRNSRLSSIKEFYFRGDSVEIAESKRYVFAKERQNEVFDIYDDLASRLTSHYEFWGKMVHLGYLPLKTFNGAAGETMVNAYRALEEFILKRRKERNHSYGIEFEWLKNKVIKKYSKNYADS